VNLPAGDANGAATWPVEPETNDIRQWREAERTSASAPSVAFARASARADSGDGGSAAPGRRAFTGSSWSSVIGQTVLPASGPSSVAAGEFLDVSGPPAPIDDHALEAHVVQAIKMQWQTGVGEATIKLRPEHLGEMTVSLRVEGGSVSADLRVETEAARSWISGHEDNLRSALERQGLTLDRIVVSQEDAAPDRRQQPERRRQQPRPRRQNAAAPGFEILA
jgi:flagellar hook-length control protein FliK